MACMQLGSKLDGFYVHGQTWHCSNGLPSDIIIEVEGIAFHLHKFPLLSRSGKLANLIGEFGGEDENKCYLQLLDIPGGAKSFLLVAKFCYEVRIELNASNVVSLRCAAEYLQMNGDYGEGNLIIQTEAFLDEVLCNWTDTIRALESCEEVLLFAEELHIVSRCIKSLATNASADPILCSWPLSGTKQSPGGTVIWNGICTPANASILQEDSWYEDVSFLQLPLFKRLIMAFRMKAMKPQRIAGCVVFYAKRYLPLVGRQSSFETDNCPSSGLNVSATSDADQMALLEDIVELLPDQNGVTDTKFLLRLLRTAIILHASPSCRENLEKRIGAQLDQAALEDLLIPNTGYAAETLYDIDCVQRMVDHFMLLDKESVNPTSNCIDDTQMMGGSHSLTPMTMVASLVDGYLAEVAPDVNLKLPKFQMLAVAIPDFARPADDGIYRAIDIYLKAHPWLTDSEREQLCRLMNSQKLSLEASTHAAQNERLPLRVIVQVLFFEQLRLRTSVAGWFYVSDHLENSQNLSGNHALPRRSNASHVQAASAGNEAVAVDDMKVRVSELEKECLSMKQEIEKLLKTKGGWNAICKRLGLRLKLKPREPKFRDPKGSPASTTPLMKSRRAGAVVSGELVD